MRDFDQKKVTRQHSPAEITDSFMQKTALGVFLLAVAYTLSVAMYAVTDEVAKVLDQLQLGIALLVLLIVFPAFLRIVKLRRRLRSDCSETDGYIVSMFTRASAKAFSLTFVFLIIMQVITEKVQTNLPAAFFINVIVAFTLGVFSITFFVLVRREHYGEQEDDFDTEPQQ